MTRANGPHSPNAVRAPAPERWPPPPWVVSTASMLAGHDTERARLRARIAHLETLLAIPPSPDGESMAAAYRAQAKALAAVLDYFNADQYTLAGLPAELHDAFRPLVIT